MAITKLDQILDAVKSKAKKRLVAAWAVDAHTIEAVNEARTQGIASIALLGRDGGKLESLADMAVVVPHQVTARIQEAHIFILHHWADVLERAVAQK